MHKEFRKLLDDAFGTSEHILAIVVDIRGFSSFCQKNESFDVADYIRHIYKKMIDNFFANATYYKPTGDGLLVIVACPNKNLQAFIADYVKRCLNLLSSFKDFCIDNPRINFETPDKIGIGISRGSACRLSTGSKTIDYSGRVINLAARLNNLARPSGMVFDYSLGFNFLPSEIQEKFATDNIYVRGIAEVKPIAIYYTKELTILDPASKKPLKEPKWLEASTTYTYEQIRKSSAKSKTFELAEVPLDLKQVDIQIIYSKIGSLYKILRLDCDSEGVSYKKIGPAPSISIDNETLKKELAKLHLADDSKIEFYFVYPVKG